MKRSGRQDINKKSILWYTIHVIKAEEVFGVALSLYEGIGSTYGLARGLFYYAQFLAAQGQTDQAIAALEQCRDKCLAVNLTDHAATAQQAINELSDHPPAG
jgi:hypothetical protein